jgi:hypothetical protein
MEGREPGTDADRRGVVHGSLTDKFNSCFDVVEHTVPLNYATGCTTRLHHVRFDRNGQPKIRELAECLVEHVIDYCLSARGRPKELSTHQAVKFTQKARKLFIPRGATDDDPDETGQAGECLLYFLIEAVLGAPQIVAKMDLKTNRRLEVNGSDGIHLSWDEATQTVDIYFGESKVYKDMGAALTKAFKSVENFHAEDLQQHEFGMVTSHFKYADDRLKDAVGQIIEGRMPDAGVRLNHAMLIGYNWNEFGKLSVPPGPALEQEFRERFLDDAPRIHQLLQTRLDAFARQHLFLNVFFLPFRCVQEFRDAFNKALE